MIQLLRKDKLDFLCGLLSCIQLLLIAINKFLLTDSINYILYINLYVTLCVFILNIITKNILQHFLVFSFYVCFFIFLLSQKIFSDEYNVCLTFVRAELGIKEYLIFNSILSIGLIITYFSYNINLNIKFKQYISCLKTNNKIVKFVWIFLLPLACYMQFAIVYNKSFMSYESGYLINIDLPYVVKIGYYLFSSLTFIYLAIRPSKLELVFIIFINVILEGGVQLLQGRRALFMTTILFWIWYIIKYFKIKKLKKIYQGAAGIFCLAAIVFLYYVEAIRGNKKFNSLSVLDILKNFFLSTGGSDSVIANTIINENLLNENGFLFLFNPIIYNPITNVIFGKLGINHGIEHINNFYNYSHWISYTTNSELYFLGYGMGSSYLAELYIAGGILGVTIVSYIIGYVIRQLDDFTFNKKNFFISFKFILVYSIFTLPRSGLFEWFSKFVYLLITIIIIIALNIIFNKHKSA